MLREQNYKKLDSFKELKANWNENGALPISNEVIKIARSIAHDMPDDAQPEFFPLVSGGIQVEWEANGKYLELTLRDDKREYFEVAFGDNDVRDWWMEGKVSKTNVSIGMLVMKTMYNKEYDLLTHQGKNMSE